MHPIEPAKPVLEHGPTNKASGNDEDLEIASSTGFTLEGKKSVFMSF